MTGTKDDVTLVVNGKRYMGWKYVRVTAGIERVARDFDIGVSMKWAGQTIDQLRIYPGDSCVLYIGSDKVLTGYVDCAPINYDAVTINIQVSGRGKTLDLVDCSAIDAPGQWLGQKVEVIAQALATPYGISVKTEVNTGAVVSDHQVQQGEGAFECIDRLLRLRQLLVTDDASGNLVFIKPGTKRATTALVLGQNIKSGGIRSDWRDRYSKITVKGQGAGSDTSFGEDVSAAKGTATDTAIKRFRNLTILQQGQANSSTCAARAAYERDLRAGRSQGLNYVVDGWRQGDGTLWTPNLIVPVTDELMGINRDMLIGEVTYEVGDTMTANLYVAPPESFQIIE